MASHQARTEPVRPARLNNRSLAGSTAWNLAGQTVAPLVALLTIPFLIHGLGTDRFGMLSLAWLVIGYFGLFDLGLGRAVTRAIAEKLGARRDREVMPLLWTALTLMLVIGLVSSVAAMVFSPWLFDRLMTVSPALEREMRTGVLFLAIALPFDMVATGLRGAMEARNRFDLTSAIRFVMSLYTYVTPLAVLLVSNRLDIMIAVLVTGRVAACLVSIVLCKGVFGDVPAARRFDRRLLGPLLRTGGWMNVSGVVYPLMVTADRFMIGALVSVTAVAYYATPYEMVTRLWTIPTAIAAVLFPVFSASFISDHARVARLFSKGTRYVFLCIFPVTLVGATLAHEGLALWLGDGFADSSGRILQILAIGVCISSLSNVPFALIQGVGRADLVAKLHLIELPLYLGAVWIAAETRGVEGIALVWAVRGVLDTLVLFAITRRLIGFRTLPVSTRVLLTSAMLFAGAVLLYESPASYKALFVAAALVGFALMGWHIVLEPVERAAVHARVRLLRSRNWRGAPASKPADAR